MAWNLNQNLNIFIQENTFENVVWKLPAIFSQPQCVKQQLHSRVCSSNGNDDDQQE